MAKHTKHESITDLLGRIERDLGRVAAHFEDRGFLDYTADLDVATDRVENIRLDLEALREPVAA